MQFLVDLNSIILLITLTVNFGLGLYIYLKGRRIEANQIFSLLLLSIALWTFSFLIFLRSQSLEWVLYLRRLTPVGSSLIACFVLYFSLVFPKRDRPLSLLQKLSILLPGFFFVLISLNTPWMIKGLLITDPSFLFLGKPVFGFAYYWFTAYFIIYFILGLINLAVKYFKSQGRERLQVFYVLFGIALAGFLGITTSLVLPLFGVPRFFTLGPPATLIMAGFVAYAIVKYKLLNIEGFLSRGIIFLALLILIIGSLYGFLYGNTAYIIAFYVVLANLALGTLVILQNYRSRRNQIFCALTLCLALWTVSLSVFQVGGEELWAKLTYAFASFIPPVFFSFVRVFPKYERKANLFEYSLYLIGGLFSLMAFSRMVIREVISLPWGFSLGLGPLYFVFGFYFFSILIYAFLQLALKYRRASGIARVQIMYIFMGTFLSAAIGVTVAILLPLIGFSRLYYLAPPSTLIMIGLIAYAIVKHRLMSIEVVIQRSSVYGIATILIMAIYALAVMVSEIYLRSVMGYTSLAVTAFAALLIAVAYQPLVRSFQGITDRLFFRGRYDYQKTLREISQQIASVIKLEELTKLIVSSFIDTMKVSEISFLLLEKEKEHFRSVSLSVPRYKNIEIDVESPIVSWLRTKKDLLARDEIEDEIAGQEALGKKGEAGRRNLEEVRDEMDRLGISIWVPIISKEEMIGIIALGNKLSGDVFTSEDIGLLSTLASQAAVALDNARLYSEVLGMKEYNEEILQSMVSGVMTVNVKSRVVTFNHMAEKITGRATSEVLGKTCEEIWGKRGTITRVVESSLKDKCYENFESGIASPERGMVPVALSSTLLRDEQKRKIGILLTIQDLTEVKTLEEKVRRADKLSALATMAAGMAHEIKNPLSSMKVLSQLLPLRFGDAEYRKKLQEIFPREIDRIDRIVESLLGFARATAPNFEKEDINVILQETLKYFKEQAENAEVKISAAYADLPEIEVDKSQISQVFSNLILNAIQAMPSGGELTIVTLAGKKIENLLQDVKIQISDTGYGISEETVKKLFDPFYTTKYGGTGLGLTITHSIVDGHRGYIDVESKVGKGTAFTVTLPVSQGLL